MKLKSFSEAKAQKAKIFQEALNLSIKDQESKGAKDIASFFQQLPLKSQRRIDIPGFYELLSRSNLQISLDYLSGGSIRQLCLFMNIKTFGSDGFLRYLLQRKFDKIRSDDQDIKTEGALNLEIDDLKHLCVERGIWIIDKSREDLVKELEEWIHYHVEKNIPTLLMFLAKIMINNQKVVEPLVEEIRLNLMSETSDKNKYDFLKKEEELISSELDKKNKS